MKCDSHYHPEGDSQQRKLDLTVVRVVQLEYPCERQTAWSPKIGDQ